MPQTSYNLDRVAAVAGQVVEKGRVVGKYQAAEEIPPGRFVVLNSSGLLELPQDTTLSKVVGVSMYRDAKEPGAWAVDDYVPVLRAGTIWAEASGGSPADLASLNVHHSSTVATNRGKATASAADATAGQEISDPGPVLCAQAADVPSGLLLVELAFPGVDSDDDVRLDALEAGLSDQGLLSFTAGDSAPAAGSIVHNGLYEIDTTAANSTVTLPAAAASGTRIYIVADGTKNGHTVTYRDATGPTAVTAAATASKRHMATAVKLDSNWFVTLAESP